MYVLNKTVSEFINILEVEIKASHPDIRASYYVNGTYKTYEEIQKQRELKLKKHLHQLASFLHLEINCSKKCQLFQEKIFLSFDNPESINHENNYFLRLKDWINIKELVKRLDRYYKVSI